MLQMFVRVLIDYKKMLCKMRNIDYPDTTRFVGNQETLKDASSRARHGATMQYSLIMKMI